MTKTNIVIATTAVVINEEMKNKENYPRQTATALSCSRARSFSG